MTHQLILALLVAIFGLAYGADLSSIEHIVVFMQENRAFDHYLGTAAGLRGFDDRAAPLLPNGKNVFTQPVVNFTSDYMLPWHLMTHKTSAVCGNAPAMGYEVDIEMWNGGRMDAWNTARSAGLGMSYWKRDDLPFYYALSDGFLTCDQYFQSTFTATNPNRLHLFSGSNGLSVGKSPVLDDSEPYPGFNWTTLAETLEDANVSWRVYQQRDNFDDNGFAWFNKFQKAKPGSPLYDKGMARSTDLIADFEKDIQSGNLPQVSWIVAPTNKSEHANNQPPCGEDFTARILKVIQANPKTYAKMAFILNYDEGGQFYDHHWTPTPPVSKEDGISTVSTVGEIISERLPIGLGFRVPAYVVSPWTRGKIGFSQVMDHTSVVKLIEKRFNVHCPNISPWRRAVTGDFTNVFDFANPDFSWPPLPDTSDYCKISDEECLSLPKPEPPTVQSMPSQETGNRVARALPYEFEVTGDITDGYITLSVKNTGQAAGVFYAYDMFTNTAPKKYTVEAGKQISDKWALQERSGHKHPYSVAVHGPNGFVRQFVGQGLSGAVNPVAELKYDKDNYNVQLFMTNPTSNTRHIQFTVIANAYMKDGPWHYTAAPGETVSDTWSVAEAGNWYDMSVVASTMQTSQIARSNLDQKWARRFMGHMETGDDTITDPAKGAALNAEGFVVGY